MAALTLSEIRQLVSKNNRSNILSDEFIICQIWKECGFRPRRNEEGSSATGMMQMTKAAIKDVNASLGQHAKHYTEQDMSDSALNIQCGTLYLDIRIKRAGNDIKAGVNGYGTGNGYVDNILACEACLKKATGGINCLVQIHP